MSSTVRVELNLRGVNELMKSPEIMASLEAAGDAVARAAGKDYATRGHQANWIGVVTVFPNSQQAAKDLYENNTLEKAISSVGLKRTKR